MQEKLRVLFVLQNAPPFKSGRARQAMQIAAAMGPYGVSLDMLSLDYHPADEKNARIRYRRSIFSAKKNYLFLLKIVMQNRYQVVHFHGFSYLVGMTNILRALGVKCVLNMSCKSLDTPQVLPSLPWLGRWQRKALGKLNYWIVQNKADLHEDFATVYLPNIVYIPEHIQPWTRRNRDIVNVGVICKRKGQVELIRQWQNKPRLAQLGMQLILCGSYTPDYEEYDAAYVEECIALAKADSSIHLLGHLSTPDLRQVLAQSRYFTAMSQWEGLSNAYLECLAYGLRPIIQPNRCDDIFRELDLAQLALHWHEGSEIDSRFFDLQWDEKISAKVIRDNFSPEHIVPQLLAMYSAPITGGDILPSDVAEVATLEKAELK